MSSPEKESVADFATRIRNASDGAYADKPDEDLVTRFIRKNPVYADRVDLPSDFSLLHTTTGYPKLDSVYEQAGKTNNVDPNLLITQGKQETINFRPDVMYGRTASPAGALGAGQFMPDTAKKYGVTDRTDPIQSINGQAKYMRKLLDQFGDNENLALAGYNAGENRTALRNGQIPNIPETQNYVKTISGNLAASRANAPILPVSQPDQTSPAQTMVGNVPAAATTEPLQPSQTQIPAQVPVASQTPVQTQGTAPQMPMPQIDPNQIAIPAAQTTDQSVAPTQQVQGRAVPPQQQQPPARLAQPSALTPQTSAPSNVPPEQPQESQAHDLPEEDVPTIQPSTVQAIGTVNVDPKASDEDKVRQAANQVLVGRTTPNGPITPDDIEKWITAAKARLPQDPDALATGNRTLNTFSVYPQMADQIAEMKKKSPEQLEEERKQRLLPPKLTDEQLRQQAIDNLSGGRGGISGISAAKYMPEGSVDQTGEAPSEGDIQQETQRLKDIQPTDEQRDEMWQAAKDFSGPNWKVPKALFSAVGFGGGGQVLHYAAGVLRPFSAMGIPDGYNAVSKWGTVAEMANALQSDVRTGEAPTAGNVVTKTVAGGLFGLAPIKIAGKAMEVAKLGKTGLGLFMGLGALEEAGKGGSAGDIVTGARKGLEQDIAFRLGAIPENPLAKGLATFTGTLAVNAAEGEPLAENVKSSLSNAAFAIHGALGDKAEGNSFRIWEDDKPNDIYIDKNKNVSVLKPDPKRKITGGEVVTDPQNPVYAQQFKNAPRTTETLQPLSEQAAPVAEKANVPAAETPSSQEQVTGNTAESDKYKNTQSQGVDKNVTAIPALSDVRPPSETGLRNAASGTYEGATRTTNEIVPIDSLGGGVRLTDPKERERVDGLKAQMQSPDGYVERIIVDGDGQVIEGQHRLEALRELGVKDVPIVRVSSVREAIPNANDVIAKLKSQTDLHPEQVKGLVDQAAGIVKDEGFGALSEYEPPKGFESEWNKLLKILDEHKSSQGTDENVPDETTERRTSPEIRKEAGDLYQKFLDIPANDKDAMAKFYAKDVKSATSEAANAFDQMKARGLEGKNPVPNEEEVGTPSGNKAETPPAPSGETVAQTESSQTPEQAYDAFNERLKNHQRNPERLAKGDIRVGDWAGIAKNERSSGINGEVTKVNPKTVEIRSFYKTWEGATPIEQIHKLRRDEITDLATPAKLQSQLKGAEGKQTEQTLPQESKEPSQVAKTYGDLIEIRKNTPDHGIYLTQLPDGVHYNVKDPSGTERGSGDAIFTSRDKAEAYSQQAIESGKSRQEREQEYQAQVKARKESEAKVASVKANVSGFTDNMSPLQRGKVEKTLQKKWSIEGKSVTTKDFVENAVSKGDVRLTTEEVNRIKDMSRLQDFRATGEQQRAHERKIKEGGKVTEYRVNGYNLGKTAYDYAMHLESKVNERQGEKASAPAAENVVGGESPKTFPEFAKQKFGDKYYVSDRPVQRYEEAGSNRVKKSDYAKAEQEWKDSEAGQADAVKKAQVLADLKSKAATVSPKATPEASKPNETKPEFRAGDRVQDSTGRKGVIEAKADGTQFVRQDKTQASIPLSDKWGKTPQQIKIDKAEAKAQAKSSGEAGFVSSSILTAPARMIRAVHRFISVEPTPALKRAGLSAEARQHAAVRISVPHVVNDLLAKVFPNSYTQPEEMAKTVDIINKDNILDGYNTFLQKEADARKAGDDKTADMWRKRAENVGSPADIAKLYQEVSDAKNDPDIVANIERWKQHINPEMDTLFNKMKGIDPNTPRDGRGLLFGARINLLTKAKEAEMSSFSDTQKPMPESVTSNYRNPNAKHDPFDRAAKFTGDYSTDAHSVLANVLGTRLNETTKLDFYKATEDKGAGVMLSPGEKPPTEINDQKAVRLAVKVPETDDEGNTRQVEKSLYVQQDIAGEVRSVVNTDARLPMHPVAKYLTELQMFQLADMSAHLKNIHTVLANAPATKTMMAQIARKFPGVGTVDAFKNIATISKDVISDTPEIRAEIAQMAKNGLIRPAYPLSGIQKITRGQQLIHAVDTSARIAMNRFFTKLVDAGRVTDTPENRMSFVQQIGEYNDRLMSPLMQAAKRSGLSPFVVAGRNFNRQGIRLLTGHPGVEAANNTEAMKFRVGNLVGGIVAAGVTPAILNVLTTGSMGGRPGTPIGAWDLGQPEDDKGKHRVVDIAQILGYRRGLRGTGIDATIAGLREGASANEILGKATSDVLSTALHPWIGPAAGFVFQGLTGQRFDLRGGATPEEARNVGGGIRQYGEQFRVALKNQNPLIYNALSPVIGTQAETEEKSYGQRLLSGAFKSPASAVGVSDVQSPAIKLMRDIQNRKGQMITTPEKEESKATAKSLITRHNQGEDVNEEMGAALRSGVVSERQLQQLKGNSKLSPLMLGVKYLELSDAVQVYERATPEEQTQLRQLLVKKAQNAAANRTLSKADLETLYQVGLFHKKQQRLQK